MNTAIKFARKPYILLSSFSAIAASSKPSSSPTNEIKRSIPSRSKSEKPSSPISMTSYLINNLSFSPSEVESIPSSKCRLIFTSTSNPDAVVSFLRSDAHLSPAQLYRFIRYFPSSLHSSVPSNILPKLDIFRSLLPPSSPPADLATLVSSCAASFTLSTSRLLRSLSLLQDLLLNDKQKVVSALCRYPRLLIHHPDKVIARNADIIRSNCIRDPQSLAHLIDKYPRVLFVLPDRLCEAFFIVYDEFEDIAPLCGLSADFDDEYLDARVDAVAVAAMLREFREKIHALRDCGFQDEDLLLIFRECPSFMRLKADDLWARADHFRYVAEVWPEEMIDDECVAMVSLERRLVPRYFLIRALKERGLVAADVDMRVAFLMSKEQFDVEFVDTFMEGKGEDLVRTYLLSLKSKSWTVAKYVGSVRSNVYVRESTSTGGW